MKNSPCQSNLPRWALGIVTVCSSLFLPVHSFANELAARNANPNGALDRGYVELQRVPQPVSGPGNSVSNGVTRLPPENSNAQSNSAVIDARFNLQQIREEVQNEQEALEQLDRNALQGRAQNGERAAQVALGVDFAKESTQLGFAPAAANEALSDAVRWYSLAARRGFPGAPSLDQSGVRFFPVRVVRDARN